MQFFFLDFYAVLNHSSSALTSPGIVKNGFGASNIIFRTTSHWATQGRTGFGKTKKEKNQF